MLLPFISRCAARHVLCLVAGTILLSLALVRAYAAPTEEPSSDSVGTIDGAAIAVSGPMRIEASGGLPKTILRSGSDVRVQSGVARLELVEGGTISVCGPAHFSVLKSTGSLTIALETGTIHAQLEREPALVIYTAQIQARPIAIGDGPQDVVVGFDAPGTMCMRANRGAIRVEQQFSGQSIVIPQAGDVLLVNGQLESLQSGASHCSCEPQIARAAPPPEPEIGSLATTAENRERAAEIAADDPPAAKDEPIYQVFMPPLVYDASAKVQPEPDPRMIAVVRRVRVRSALVFRSSVKDEPMAAAVPSKAQPTLPTPQPPAATVAPRPATPANVSLFERIRNFFRRLWFRGDRSFLDNKSWKGNYIPS